MRHFLIEARMRAGLSRAQLAAMLGVSEDMVYKVEIRQRDPSVKLAKRWAAALNIPWIYFYEDLPDNTSSDLHAHSILSGGKPQGGNFQSR